MFGFIDQAIGVNSFSLIALIHMMIRGSIIYLLGISITRFNKKFLGVRTPFNFVLFVMLGSIFANAIVDKKIFIALLLTTLFLFLLNGLITAAAFYFPALELFLKGEQSVLVKNGEIQWKTMRNNFITKQELINELSNKLHKKNLDTVESANLVSDGTINFIEKNNVEKNEK